MVIKLSNKSTFIELKNVNDLVSRAFIYNIPIEFIFTIKMSRIIKMFMN